MIKDYRSIEEMFNDMDEIAKQGEEAAKQAKETIESFAENPSQLGLFALFVSLERSVKNEDHGRIKETGQLLHDIGERTQVGGGLKLMQLFCSAFYPSEGYYLISSCWNHVGERLRS